MSSDHLAEWQDMSPLVVQLLYNRGLRERAQFEAFIAADERWEGDPFLLPGMERAVARLLSALSRGEVIAIYGDFDADGITATALLTQGLSRLGGKVVPYIPHRLEEGYGLNQAALEGLKSQGVDLVVTADCGISNLAEVEQAREMGLDIIITDHHSPPPTTPPAVAVINPKQAESAYPFPELAGVGVAFKLLQALLGRAGRHEADDFLDLVCLGTVADLVPLLGENRYLVKRGLELLNRGQRLGLRELIGRAGLKLGGINTDSISYALGPRLNAAGRLAHALISYQLLITDSPDRARQLAAVLEEKNLERQKLTLRVLSAAREKLQVDSPLLLVGGEDYPAGVVGIVAGKLVEEFYRPALVLELGPEVSRGSARSIPEFNIIAALRGCRELLSRFGGHAQAAGFTLPTSNIPRFHQQLLELARSQLADIDLRPTLTIDAEVPLSSLRGETFQLIEKLAPFGQANPAPTFLSRRVRVVDYYKVGSRGEHLRLRLRDGNVTWQAIGFDLGSREIGSHLDIVYNLDVEDWSGRELLQLNVLDLASAS